MIEVKIERHVMDTVDEKKNVLCGWPSLVRTGAFWLQIALVSRVV